jgi:hypothetical protein
MDKAKKSEILTAAKAELMRHAWDTFVDEPPSVAQGGNGVVVTGCVACKIKNEHERAVFKAPCG